MNTSSKALYALLGTVLLWSFMVVIARFIVQDISPIRILFLRLLVATVAFLPIFIRNTSWRKPHFSKLAIVSLGSTINLTFFMLGIAHTTASVSQVIYATIPIIVIFVEKFVYKDKHPLRKILGVLTGFAGLLFIVYLSSVEKGTTITGTLKGNIFIVIAMFGWTSYLLLSKKLSKYFSPLEIGSTSIVISFIVACGLYIYELIFLEGTFGISIWGLVATFYMGFAGTFLTYILYQYAIHHLSPLSVSLTSYIQPITTAILAIVFLGEKLTIYFILGSLMVFSGVFLTSTLNLKSVKNLLPKLPLME